MKWFVYTVKRERMILPPLKGKMIAWLVGGQENEDYDKRVV
jgi:hypothetical protein